MSQFPLWKFLKFSVLKPSRSTFHCLIRRLISLYSYQGITLPELLFSHSLPSIPGRGFHCSKCEVQRLKHKTSRVQSSKNITSVRLTANKFNFSPNRNESFSLWEPAVSQVGLWMAGALGVQANTKGRDSRSPQLKGVTLVIRLYYAVFRFELQPVK